MAKPTRIKSSAIAVFANDVQLDRITAFGSSTRLNPEDLKEIGNLNIVEVVDGVPTVEATIDQHQYGSIKNICAFANKSFNYSYTLVQPSGDSTAVLVSSGTYFYNEGSYTLDSDKAVEFASDINNLTANQKQIAVLSLNPGFQTVTKTLGTPTTGTPTAPSTPSGQLKIAEVQLENGVTKITSDYIINVHDSKEINLRNFEYAKVDFTVPVKESGDNTTSDPISRSCVIKDAYLTRLDFSFSATGEATIAYGFESDNKTWYLNSASNIITDRFDATGTNFTLSRTPTTLADGSKTLRVRRYDPTTDTYTTYEEGTDFTVSGTTLTFNFSLPGGTLIVRYASNAGATFFRQIPALTAAHPQPAGGLRSGNIEIYLSDDPGNKVLRLQTVSINTALNREALNEIGSTRAYSRPLTFPIPVTINVETKASDLEDFARLCGVKDAFEANTLKEIGIEDFIKSLDLTVKCYREDDRKRAELPVNSRKPIFTLRVDNVSVTEEGGEVRVDSDLTQTFSLKADNLTITGVI